MVEKKEVGDMGMDENTRAAVTYVLGWLTGILFLLTEKKSDYVKFHAMQSTITFLGLTVLAWILNAMIFTSYGAWYTFAWIMNLVWIMVIILWIVLMVKAYQGERFKLPVIGDIAENQLK